MGLEEIRQQIINKINNGEFAFSDIEEHIISDDISLQQLFASNIKYEHFNLLILLIIII
jgi:hypothetical protein